MSDPVKKGQKYQNREAFKAHRNIKRAVRDVEAEAALKAKACARASAGDARKRCARRPSRPRADAHSLNSPRRDV